MAEGYVNKDVWGCGYTVTCMKLVNHVKLVCCTEKGRT